MHRAYFSLFFTAILGRATLAAEPEWPQWHGPNRDRVWPARDLPAKLAKTPPRRWMKPLGGGFGGVAVSGGLVYVMDHLAIPNEVERVVCMELDTGKTKWVREYPVAYKKLDYGNGPRCTPTIHDGMAYTLGAVGHLHCLNASTGEIVWKHDCVQEYSAKIPMWGLACSPLINRDQLLVQVGAKDGCIMAFDRKTGAVAWKGLQDRAGYASPVRIDVGKSKLVIMWTAENVNGLDAETGKPLWSLPFAVTYDVAISDPVWHDGVLLCGQYWEGSLALKLDENGMNPQTAWQSRKLRLLMSTPLIRDGHAYCLDRNNGLVCVEMKTGKIKWDGFRVSYDKSNPHASVVWTGDGRALILNEKGELIQARLSPEKYEEQGRSKIFDGSWAHPAFAHGCIVVRDDRQILCVKLIGD
jgi:outer membrane protein assembly factor BamB